MTVVNINQRLTVAYLFGNMDDENLRQEMLDCFKDSELTPVEYPAIEGNLAQARADVYAEITTPYVVMIDPDDLVRPDVLEACVDYLEAHPDCAACSALEGNITENGQFHSYRRFPDDIAAGLLRSVRAFHHPVVMRMSVVREYAQALLEHNFYNYDYALKLCLAFNHPVHRLEQMGYLYRERSASHSTGSVIKPGQIPQHKTVRELARIGLIQLPESKSSFWRWRRPG